MPTRLCRRAPTAPAPRSTIADLLDDQQNEFDELMRELRGGIRSAAHFDALEEKASAIGRAMRDAFRRGSRR